MFKRFCWRWPGLLHYNPLLHVTVEPSWVCSHWVTSPGNNVAKGAKVVEGGGGESMYKWEAHLILQGFAHMVRKHLLGAGLSFCWQGCSPNMTIIIISRFKHKQHSGHTVVGNCCSRSDQLVIGVGSFRMLGKALSVKMRRNPRRL